MSDFISVRWTLDLGWRGAQWDGGLAGRSQCVSQTWHTAHSEPISASAAPSSLLPSFLSHWALSPLNPCPALHSDISLLHSCTFLQTNWTAHATLCWLRALLPSVALNGVIWVFQSAIYIMLFLPRNMKGTPQLSDFAYPSQVGSVLTAFTPQSPTFSAQAQFYLSDYHYLNFIKIQIIGSSTIFWWIAIVLPVARGKIPKKTK